MLAGAAVALGACGTVHRPPPQTAADVAITHVNVVDVVSGRVSPDQTIVITGNRIRVIAPSASVSPAPGARVLNAAGQYAVPGLWDMHTHYWNDSATARTATPLLLANGVTGIRDMAADLGRIVSWRDSVRSGRLIGPRAIVAGPVVDGPPPATTGNIVVRTPEEAIRAVDSLANAGVDFIKAYEMLRPDALLPLIRRAHAHGLRVAGHVPLAVDAREASDAGMATFEHLRNLELACSARADSLRAARVRALNAGLADEGRALRSRILSEQRPAALDTQDPARCAGLLERLARNGTWQVPTLWLDEAPLTLEDSTRMRRVREAEPFVSADMAAWWNDQAAAFARAPEEARERAVRIALWQRALISRLRDAGVPLLAGTDFPNLFTLAGVSLHEELAALRDAGLSNLEALQTATLSPARFLHATDSLGTVAPGKLADLVIVAADPLQDVANLRRVSAVVVNGRPYDRAALDSLLAAARRAAR